jgi:hypothetical protein
MSVYDTLFKPTSIQTYKTLPLSSGLLLEAVRSTVTIANMMASAASCAGTYTHIVVVVVAVVVVVYSI